jgi:hypothetical protein
MIRKDQASYIRGLWEDNQRVHTELRYFNRQEERGLLIDRAPTNFGGGGSSLVLLLKSALERVFVLGSKREDIRHFLLGFFARVGAANSFSPHCGCEASA